MIHVVDSKVNKVLKASESEQTKGTPMRNNTSIARFRELSRNFQKRISRESHLHASDCFLNNAIEWAIVITCTCVEP